MNTIVDALQLARILRVRPATIHSWHRRGLIPGLRVGRRPVLFDLDHVLDTLRDHAESRPEADAGEEE